METATNERVKESTQFVEVRLISPKQASEPNFYHVIKKVARHCRWGIMAALNV